MRPITTTFEKGQRVELARKGRESVQQNKTRNKGHHRKKNISKGIYPLELYVTSVKKV